MRRALRRPASAAPRRTTTRKGATPTAAAGGRSLSALGASLALLLGTVSIALWAMFASPLLEVRTVEVRGAGGVPEDVVRQAAGVRVGTPLARIDTSAVAAEVAGLPRVASARVSRQWPHTLEVSVQERSAVARADAAGKTLVDRSGTLFPAAGEDVARLPELRAARGTDRVARAEAVRVLTALAEEQRRAVRLATVRPDRRVELELSDGRTVEWGTVADSARKAAVLDSLVTGPAGRGMRRFDVSAPEAPSVAP